MKELNAGNQRKEVYYQEGSKGECGKARPVLKKKKKKKRKLLSALKTLGEATSCGGIFAQITLTPFP